MLKFFLSLPISFPILVNPISNIHPKHTDHCFQFFPNQTWSITNITRMPLGNHSSTSMIDYFNLQNMLIFTYNHLVSEILFAGQETKVVPDSRVCYFDRDHHPLQRLHCRLREDEPNLQLSWELEAGSWKGPQELQGHHQRQTFMSK